MKQTSAFNIQEFISDMKIFFAPSPSAFIAITTNQQFKQEIQKVKTLFELCKVIYDYYNRVQDETLFDLKTMLLPTLSELLANSDNYADLKELFKEQPKFWISKIKNKENRMNFLHKFFEDIKGEKCEVTDENWIERLSIVLHSFTEENETEWVKEVIDFAEKSKILNKIIDSQLGDLGNTTLHLAVRNQNVELVSLFVDKGANSILGYKKLDTEISSTIPLIYAIDSLVLENKSKKKQEENTRDNLKNIIDTLLNALKKLDITNVTEIMGKVLCRITCANETDLVKEVVRIAEEKGILESIINKKDTVGFGNTPFLYAIENGNEELIKFFLEKGADYNQKNLTGSSPLHLAVENENEKIVKILLEKEDTERHSLNTQGYSPLCLAVDSRNNKIVNLLLEKDPIWWISLNEETDSPLCIAIKSFLEDELSKKQESKAVIETMLSYIEGETTLSDSEAKIKTLVVNFYRLIEAGEIELAEKIIVVAKKKKISDRIINPLKSNIRLNENDKMIFRPTYENEEKNTPLHVAIMHANKKLVDILLKNGADCYTYNKKKSSPLRMVTEKFILEKDKTEKDKLSIIIDNLLTYIEEHQTEFQINQIHSLGFMFYRLTQSDEAILVSKMISLFDSKKILSSIINVPSETDHNTPLHIVVTNENIDLFNLFLSKGANYTEENKNGDSAIKLALNSTNFAIREGATLWVCYQMLFDMAEKTYKSDQSKKNAKDLKNILDKYVDDKKSAIIEGCNFIIEKLIENMGVKSREFHNNCETILKEIMLYVFELDAQLANDEKNIFEGYVCNDYDKDYCSLFFDFYKQSCQKKQTPSMGALISLVRNNSKIPCSFGTDLNIFSGIGMKGKEKGHIFFGPPKEINR